MDLFGPVNVLSTSRNKYALVMVDDFSIYTWIEFMHSKDENSHIIIEHIKKHLRIYSQHRLKLRTNCC